MTDEDLIARMRELDPVLEVEFDTQRDVERNPYGAAQAIEKALYLLRDQADRIEALVKERDIAAGMYMRSSDEGFRQKARADAAEAELLAMRLAVQHANDHAAAAIKDMEALVKERDDLIHDLERIKDSETEQLNRAERLEAALRRIANREIHEMSMADVARAALTQKDRTDG